jgi:hypothetical protein
MKLANILKSATLSLAAAGVLFLSGCAVEMKPAFNDPSVRSVLVVPVVSESTQVGSDVLMYSTSTTPIAEKGFYPFPVETVKMVLEQEGLYEPERVQQVPPAKLAEMFSADSVLLIRVLSWDTKYAVFNTKTEVIAQYNLYLRDGTELWQDKISCAYDSSSTTSSSLVGLLVQAAVAAVTRAQSDMRPAAVAVSNRSVLTWPHGPILLEEIAAAKAGK